MSEVTLILSQIQSGDLSAGEQLLPLVYQELRKLASAKLTREQPGQTLQATALVHEAYLRLVGDGEQGPIRWDSRGHFFAAAGEAMRRILVENARRKNRLKHGGEFERVPLESIELPARMGGDDLLALDEALIRLQCEDPVKARLVTLRFFAGLTIEQAAEVLDISRVTAHRYWTFARAWLYREMNGQRQIPPETA